MLATLSKLKPVQPPGPVPGRRPCPGAQASWHAVEMPIPGGGRSGVHPVLGDGREYHQNPPASLRRGGSVPARRRAWRKDRMVNSRRPGRHLPSSLKAAAPYLTGQSCVPLRPLVDPADQPDRAFRIGQTRGGRCTSSSAFTLEEKIEMIERKKEWPRPLRGRAWDRAAPSS